MSVIVHSSETIDVALKRLHREVLREKILETLKNKAYRVKDSVMEAEKRRAWSKMRRRSRSAARKSKSK